MLALFVIVCAQVMDEGSTEENAATTGNRCYVVRDSAVVPVFADPYIALDDDIQELQSRLGVWIKTPTC